MYTSQQVKTVNGLAKYENKQRNLHPKVHCSCTQNGNNLNSNNNDEPRTTA